MDLPILFWLMTLSGTDLRERRLPNAVTLPVVLAGSIASVAHHVVVVSMVVAAVPYLMACVVGGCGGGDVKMALGLGAILADPVRAIAVVALAAMLTLVVIVATAMRRGGGIRRRVVPHGPALAVAAVLAGGLGP